MNETENKVSPVETVTRYIFSSRHYAADRGRVKYNALMPRNGETSVFRINNLPFEQIWDIGSHVGNVSNRTLRARGDIAAEDILSEDLRIEPDTQEHPLHANIIGWPAQDAKIRLIASKLADKAQLHLRPSLPEPS